MSKQKAKANNQLVNGGNLDLTPQKKVKVKVPKKKDVLKAIEVIEKTGLMGVSEIKRLTLMASRTLKK